MPKAISLQLNALCAEVRRGVMSTSPSCELERRVEFTADDLEDAATVTEVR